MSNLIDFKACLKLLEESDDYEGLGFDYASCPREDDYDDEIYYDEVDFS